MNKRTAIAVAGLRRYFATGFNLIHKDWSETQENRVGQSAYMQTGFCPSVMTPKSNTELKRRGLTPLFNAGFCAWVLRLGLTLEFARKLFVLEGSDLLKLPGDPSCAFQIA